MGPVLDLQGVGFGFALLGLVLGAHLRTALSWHFPGTGSIFGERHGMGIWVGVGFHCRRLSFIARLYAIVKVSIFFNAIF